jgi:four helix bundle protein
MQGEKGRKQEEAWGKEYGFKRLVVWQNAYALRLLVYKTTGRFPKIETRRVSQMRDAARSVKQNIQEGYKRPAIGEYIRFLTIAQSSLAEFSGDIEDCHEDGIITDGEFKDLDALCGKTDYLFNRLIRSLRLKQKEGTWNTRA